MCGGSVPTLIGPAGGAGGRGRRGSQEAEQGGRAGVQVGEGEAGDFRV